MELKELTVEELSRGYVRSKKEGALICIFCGETFMEENIYNYAGTMVTAERAMIRHIFDVHGGAFHGLINLDKQINGLSEIQKQILTGMYEEKENREPTIEELSVKCDISKEDVVIALNAMGAVQSIDKEIAYGNSEKKITLGEKIEDKTQSQEKVINKLFVKQILETLEEKEKTIIVLRYFKNKTQSEIASKLGLTQVQISRLEKKILKKLRAQGNF